MNGQTMESMLFKEKQRKMLEKQVLWPVLLWYHWGGRNQHILCLQLSPLHKGMLNMTEGVKIYSKSTLNIRAQGNSMQMVPMKLENNGMNEKKPIKILWIVRYLASYINHYIVNPKIWYNVVESNLILRPNIFVPLFSKSRPIQTEIFIEISLQ